MERIKQALDKARQSQPAGNRSRQGVAARPAVAPKAHDETELEDIQYHNTPVVPLDPKVLEEHRIVAHNKNDTRAAAFDLLRTQILRKMHEHGWRSLAITSPGIESGKTTVAINLALSLAHQTNQTVLLADFDLRRPKIAEYLGLPTEKSLVDFIQGNAEIEEVLANPGVQRLVVLPNGGAVSNAAELLTSARMKSLVADLKTRYESRIVIFDLPPLLATDDAIAFLPEVDCALLVVANGHTTKSELEESLRLLKSTELVGTVLNKSEAKSRPYY